MLFLLTRTIQPVIGQGVNTELDWTRPVAFLPALEVPTPEVAAEAVAAFGGEPQFKSAVLDFIAATVTSKASIAADQAHENAKSKAHVELRARLGRP